MLDGKNWDESGYLPSPSLDLLRSSLYPEKTRQWCSDVWAALPILNLALFCKLHTTSYLIFYAQKRLYRFIYIYIYIFIYIYIDINMCIYTLYIYYYYYYYYRSSQKELKRDLNRYIINCVWCMFILTSFE
jgi:hypothetical protein